MGARSNLRYTDILSTFRTKISWATKKEQNYMDNICAERVSKTIILINCCEFQGLLFFRMHKSSIYLHWWYVLCLVFSQPHSLCHLLKGVLDATATECERNLLTTFIHVPSFQEDWAIIWHHEQGILTACINAVF